jgi:glycine/D-amino acid oxidase-like deaminating enzyme
MEAFESSTDPLTRSYWLFAGPSAAEQPALEGPLTADVAIVGGGYTGLWTALFLKAADPSLDIVLLEQEIVGYGASGRNAGFAMTVLDYSLHHLVKKHGIERARVAHDQVARSVHAIGEFAEEYGYDCEYEPNGFIAVANGDGQVSRIQRDVDAAEKLGLDDLTYLDRKAVQEHVHSQRFACGYLERTCALLNPAKLAWGLKDVVLEEGVRLFERTPVRGIQLGEKIRLETFQGAVEAEKVVLATNAWSHAWKPIGLRELPLYTYIVLSEPLSRSQREGIGWQHREGLEDKQNYLHYFRLTKEDRLLWGGEAMYFYGPSIGLQHDRNRAAFDTIEAEFRQTFPQLSDLRFEYRWGGPIAVTAKFVPTFGRVPGTGLYFGYGYSGHGVAPTHLGGQILRDLVLERDTELTHLFMVATDKAATRFPPEPGAFVSERISRRALKKQDEEMAGGKDVGDFEPWILRVLNRLS